jgi:hypothetical protein
MMVFRGANISGRLQEVREIVRARSIPSERTYAAIHAVQTPTGYRYHYYADSTQLAYLKFYRPGRSSEADRERDSDVEALALSFVDSEHYDEAKLPPGVLEVIKEERAKRRVPFPGCAVYLNAGRTPSAPSSTARP